MTTIEHISAPPSDQPVVADLIVGDDGLRRPSWAAHDPVLRAYYDTEWGSLVTDERELFEILALECFQAGLSWQLVLRRREAFRIAFDGFEPDLVAAYGEDDLTRLLATSDIIRNRRKIEAVIANAQATVVLRADGGLVELVWAHMPPQTPLPRTMADLPVSTPESEALAAALRSRGFRWVGPVTMHALMAAAGVVDCHLVGSHRRGCTGLWTRTGRRKHRPALT